MDTDVDSGDPDRQGEQIGPGAGLRIDQGNDGGFGKDIDGVGGRKAPGIGTPVQKMGSVNQMTGALSLKDRLQDPARQGIRNRHAESPTNEEKSSFQAEAGSQKGRGHPDGQKKILGIGDIEHALVEPVRVRREKNIAIEGKIECLQEVIQRAGRS